MEIENQIKDLKIPESKILYQEPMRKYTTFKIGGLAECLIKIDSLDELKEILTFVNQNHLPLTIIGNGSNLLISDKGIKGITLMIKLEKIDMREKNDTIQITVGAGSTNMLTK